MQKKWGNSEGMKFQFFNGVADMQIWVDDNNVEIIDIQMQMSNGQFGAKMAYLLTYRQPAQRLQNAPVGMEIKSLEMPWVDEQTPPQFDDVPESECLCCGKGFEIGEEVRVVEDGAVCSGICFTKYAVAKLQPVMQKWEGVQV